MDRLCKSTTKLGYSSAERALMYEHTPQPGLLSMLEHTTAPASGLGIATSIPCTLPPLCFSSCNSRENVHEPQDRAVDRLGYQDIYDGPARGPRCASEPPLPAISTILPLLASENNREAAVPYGYYRFSQCTLSSDVSGRVESERAPSAAAAPKKSPRRKTGAKRDYWSVVLNSPPTTRRKEQTDSDSRPSATSSQGNQSRRKNSTSGPASTPSTHRRKRRRTSAPSAQARASRPPSQASRFQCEECNSLFKRKYDLLQHVSAVHRKERPFKCTVCQTTFAHKGTLSKHFRTVHLGEKPFQCTFPNCNSRFSERGNLNKHVARIHTRR